MNVRVKTLFLQLKLTYILVGSLYQLVIIIKCQKMASVTVTNKQIKLFCTSEIEVKEGISEYGETLYIKFIRNDTIDDLDISQCLEFNRCVLGDIEGMVFPQHFLKIESEMSNKEVVGFVRQPYNTNLQIYLRGKTLTEKDVLQIFDQILKSIYSLYQEGYATRNLRTQHFVLSNKLWKLQSLVYNEMYQQGSGSTIQYLWSPRHQAPQCFHKIQYHEEDFDPMIVWNLGSILVQMLIGTHKFATLQTMEKFKGKPFSFDALGIKQHVSGRFSEDMKAILANMLHFDPKKRTKLTQIFQAKFLSLEVAQKYVQNKNNVPTSKIFMGKSSVKPNIIDKKLENTLREVRDSLRQKELENHKIISSRASGVMDDQDFLSQLGAISNKIGINKVGKKKPLEPQSLDDLMQCSHEDILKALQLYKSYYDQSQLLMLAIEVIEDLDFPGKSPQQVNELKILIRYAVMFVSQINLNSLAQGFNLNRNILDLDGQVYTAFQSCDQYVVFQKIINLKRKERGELLQSVRNKILKTKDKPLVDNNPSLSKFLQFDYKKTTFQNIKVSYRLIVKHAYDTITNLYNQKKKTSSAKKLAQTALYVTYCLTIDKLYIKEHITDNFKFYFQWMQQSLSNYVPAKSFKKYIEEASKELLIENSRYILKKYYNI